MNIDTSWIEHKYLVGGKGEKIDWVNTFNNYGIRLARRGINVLDEDQKPYHNIFMRLKQEAERQLEDERNERKSRKMQ